MIAAALLPAVLLHAADPVPPPDLTRGAPKTLEHVALLIAVLALAGVVLAMMVKGWRTRQRRTAPLAPLPEVPEIRPDEVVGPLRGLYVGTTTDVSWLDRVVTHGLSRRAQGSISVTGRGVLMRRTGEQDLWLPLESITAVRVDGQHAGKMIGRGAITVVTWDLGGTILESGFRCDPHAGNTDVVRAVQDLLSDEVAEHPAAPGSASHVTLIGKDSAAPGQSAGVAESREPEPEPEREPEPEPEHVAEPPADPLLVPSNGWVDDAVLEPTPVKPVQATTPDVGPEPAGPAVEPVAAAPFTDDAIASVPAPLATSEEPAVAGQPEEGQAEAGQPESGQPQAGQPEAAETRPEPAAAGHRAEAGQPAEAVPASADPGATQPSDGIDPLTAPWDHLADAGLLLVSAPAVSATQLAATAMGVPLAAVPLVDGPVEDLTETGPHPPAAPSPSAPSPPALVPAVVVPLATHLEPTHPEPTSARGSDDITTQHAEEEHDVADAVDETPAHDAVAAVTAATPAGAGPVLVPEHVEEPLLSVVKGSAALVRGVRPSAVYVLEDGRVFRGQGYGAIGSTIGEAVFCTAMTGYQETLTDPSYHGQVVAMTAPHIGNTGINAGDMESSRIWVAGFVVRDPARISSSWRSEKDLDAWLAESGVVGLSGIDTRALTRHLRDKGSMRVGVASDGSNPYDLLERVKAAPSMEGADLARQVTTKVAYTIPAQGEHRFRVVAVDLGIKAATPRSLAALGCQVVVVPATITTAEILALKPDGVFYSNGPGDPATAGYAIDSMSGLLGTTPVFGICMGNQILGHALGLGTFKLPFGHRGINQPVLDKVTGRVQITAQNHGFAVIAPLTGTVDTPYGRAMVSHIGLNDQVVEGLRCLDVPAFSVQFHPEAAAGPHDAAGMFERFVALMETHKNTKAA